MKNKQIIPVLLIVLFILFVGILIYKFSYKFNSIKFTNTFPYFSQPEKSYNLSGYTVKVIDNSSFVNVSVDNKLKLDQIIRRYSNLYNPPNDTVRIIFVDDIQDISFSWQSGTPFSHSVDILSPPNIDISININPEVLKNANWDLDQVEMEIEGILIMALERASINVVPDTSATYSEQEEAEKSDSIESTAAEAVDQLNTDNQEHAFDISYE